jgi:hypothetical protein
MRRRVRHRPSGSTVSLMAPSRAAVFLGEHPRSTPSCCARRACAVSLPRHLAAGFRAVRGDRPRSWPRGTAAGCGATTRRNWRRAADARPARTTRAPPPPAPSSAPRAEKPGYDHRSRSGLAQHSLEAPSPITTASPTAVLATQTGIGHSDSARGTELPCATKVSLEIEPVLVPLPAPRTTAGSSRIGAKAGRRGPRERTPRQPTTETASGLAPAFQAAKASVPATPPPRSRGV